MKSTSFIVICLFFLFHLNAQGLKEVGYIGVVEVSPNLKSGQLFSIARQWVADNYLEYKDGIIADPSTGELIGKGSFKYHADVPYGGGPASGKIMYSIKIFVKDGKYKYEFSHFVHSGTDMGSHVAANFGLITESQEPTSDIGPGSDANFRANVWQDIKKKIDSEMHSTIQSLNDFISQKASNKNDW